MSAYLGDYNQLLYLRARHYAPSMGRFLAKDTWEGNFAIPASLNKWSYVHNNPVNLVDPSGYCVASDEKCWSLLNEIHSKYSNVQIDSGYWAYILFAISGCPPINLISHVTWTTLELESVKAALGITDHGITQLGGNFPTLAGTIVFRRAKIEGDTTTLGNVITVRNIRDYNYRTKAIIHELGHVIRNHKSGSTSYFMNEIGSSCHDGNRNVVLYCHERLGIGAYEPGPYVAPSIYAEVGNGEDYAETFTAVISEAYLSSGDTTFRRHAQYIYGLYNHSIAERKRAMISIINGTWTLMENGIGH